ncbi:leucine-rich repeat domain-containing protein [Wolbachia endosymbiont of Ceratosolen solmsi]|uniref:leucine-rich repeat domain-containing protein n=1 Tax=Wolbachia endosymbiont of Ceratosolen solmsi TaxID=497299 RepID=UPI001AEA9CA2|nr:leucine-rich repeat domain-containing protein [Wolbachia endosymbiont of Ceratosolen solmsi]QTP63452.1 leucine-rich repeat domain-containing protein [Wolbachia endosymbiont of Ceratosolen solmsi]
MIFYTQGDTPALCRLDYTDVSKLVGIPNITRLDLTECKISVEIVKELAELINLTSLHLGKCKISVGVAKELTKLTNLPSLNIIGYKISGKGANVKLQDEVSNSQEKLKSSSKYYICGATVGLVIGLVAAYCLGAATLTPVGVSVAAFIASAVVGALLGAGVGYAVSTYLESTELNNMQPRRSC